MFCIGVLFALFATPLRAQIEVTVRPRAALIETAGSLTATATVSGLVTGQRNGVSWSVNGINTSTSTNFSYSPSSTPEDVSIILRASSLADQSRFGALPIIRLLKSEGAQISFPQAVAYHPSTERIYVASLVARPTDIDTSIYEISPSGTVTLITTLTSELIDKLLPYRSAGGAPYLLAVSLSTDSVQALNLGTGTAHRVVGGLVTPVSAGIHPDSGDLYIAEQNARRISVVTREALDVAVGGTSTAPFQALPVVIPDVSGIGFLPDRETDRVFLLVTSTGGALYQVDLHENTFSVLTTGLRRAQEILTLESPQMDASFTFVASPPTSNIDEQGTVAAIVSGGSSQVPGGYQMATGLDVPTDITFLPSGNAYSPTGQPVIVGINSSATASRGKIIFWEVDPLSPAGFYSYLGRALPTIRLLSPSEGDVLQPGFPTEIRWNYSDSNPLNSTYAPYPETVRGCPIHS